MHFSELRALEREILAAAQEKVGESRMALDALPPIARSSQSPLAWVAVPTRGKVSEGRLFR